MALNFIIRYFLLIASCSLLGFQLAHTQQPLPDGGGAQELVYKQHNCLNPAQREQIKKQLASNINTLEKSGLISAPKSGIIASFSWPLEMEPNDLFTNYYSISNFVDQNPTIGPADFNQYSQSNLDYNCGNRSYDTSSGYNHSGIDYSLWPFEWYMFNEGLINVVAAEDGIVIGRDDNNFDANCQCQGSWNALYVRHDDGSTAWYGHLQRGNITNLDLGATISKGDYIGKVGSSGCSTGPHLHFETYDIDGNLIDPYEGACNDLNPSTWWEEQPDYRTPDINAIFTHDLPPTFGCVFEEQPNIKNDFDAGEQVITAFYFKDAEQGSITNMRINDPSGNLWQNWNFESPETYSGSYWYWIWNMPLNGPFGIWTVEASFEGSTLTHDFAYGEINTNTADHSLSDLQLFPLPATDRLFINKTIGDKQISVVDLFGVQHQVDAGPNFIKIDQLKDGIYFLRLEIDGQSISKKFIKSQN